jgi:hypothetical protein
MLRPPPERHSAIRIKRSSSQETTDGRNASGVDPMDTHEGRGVRPKIPLLKRCHLLPFLFKPRTRTTMMLHTLRTTNLLKRFLIYPSPAMISWSQLPMSLVMDTLRL